MTRTHEKVRNFPLRQYPSGAEAASDGVESVFRVLEGRWKLNILFNLFGRRTRRFSELERSIPEISQKMLAQQLRGLEQDGIVRRTVHPEVPPRVEYALTEWGEALCPALDALLRWATVPSKPEHSAAEP